MPQPTPEAAPKPTPEQIRNRYIKMAHTSGYDEAITTIHNELTRLEPAVFDGGFNADRFKHLQFMREVARELFTLKLTEDSKIYYQKK